MLLLDTHVFLWWSTGSGRLKDPARTRIAQAPEVFVSAASAWEAAIKISLGRLELDVPFDQAVEVSGFTELPVTLHHASAYAQLPPHHTDPFDRMLIAQARSEGLTLVTHDRQLEAYEVPLIRV